MRNAISIVLIIILAIVTPVLLLISSIKYNVVTPRFLKHELASHHAYDIAVAQLAQKLGTVQLDSSMPFTQADLQTLAQRAITPTWLQQNIESTIDRTFAWFNGPTSMMLSVPIDLHQPKTNLSQGFDELLTAALPKLAECPKRGKVEGVCRTNNFTTAQFKDQLKQKGLDISGIVAQLPDTVDLANPVVPSLTIGSTADQPAEPSAPVNLHGQIQPVLDRLNHAKSIYRQALQYYLYAVISYALLILGYFALNATKGLRRFVRWAGILALSIGVLPMALGIASKIALDKLLLPKVHFDASVPQEVQSVVPLALKDLQHALFFMILISGAVLMALGLGALLDAKFILRPATKK